ICHCSTSKSYHQRKVYNSVPNITPQLIAGTLRRAGFKASKARPTNIKGWYEYSAGFKVHLNYGRDAVLVHYRTGGHHTNREMAKAKVTEMKDALEKRGFKVDMEAHSLYG